MGKILTKEEKEKMTPVTIMVFGKMEGGNTGCCVRTPPKDPTLKNQEGVMGCILKIHKFGNALHFKKFLLFSSIHW